MVQKRHFVKKAKTDAAAIGKYRYSETVAGVQPQEGDDKA